MFLWSSWDDFNESFLNTWPYITGKLHLEEIAIILDVAFYREKIVAAKIYTQSNQSGWINADYLITITI